LIETLNIELSSAEEGILRNQDVIVSLERDVSNMRSEYARTVRNAFRQKSISNPLLYILSAESLNQAFRRWLFLRKYDQRRHEAAAAIVATQTMLTRKVDLIKDTRLEKESLLLSMQSQELSLKVELVEKDKILQVLSKDEARLKVDLHKKQAEHEALNKAIENIISEQVRKRVEEARKKNAAPPPSPSKKPEKKPVFSPTNAEKNTNDVTADAVSLGFAKNRGRLPWPVESGFISRAFGRQKHPTLKNIEITNNGVDIRTEEHSVVHAVFEGRVAGTQFIPGHDYTVILQHGDYYTVYSNLAETNLSKGDNVRAQQNIGTVSYNPITGSSELHFELWHDKERINPSGWIKK
jgi:septal ring factor EnvC (AmiA/AmiB activator)